MSRSFAALLIVTSLSVPAMADDGWPDLTGVWTGVSPSVVRGNPPHHQSTEPAGEVRISERAFTMTIEGQEGRTFWGTIASPDSTEGIVGAIAADRQTLHIADTDGYASAVLIEPDVMDVCYVLSSTEVQVAACYPMTRED